MQNYIDTMRLAMVSKQWIDKLATRIWLCAQPHDIYIACPWPDKATADIHLYVLFSLQRPQRNKLCGTPFIGDPIWSHDHAPESAFDPKDRSQIINSWTRMSIP